MLPQFRCSSRHGSLMFLMAVCFVILLNWHVDLVASIVHISTVLPLPRYKWQQWFNLSSQVPLDFHTLVSAMRAFALNVFLGLYSVVSNAQPSPLIDAYVSSESPIAKANLLANIGPSGSRSSGAKVLASHPTSSFATR